MNARNPRQQGPIDPLMRLQQLEDRRQPKGAPRPAQGQPQQRSQQLPPPNPAAANRSATPRPAGQRPAAPGGARQTTPTTGTLTPGVKPSAQAAARIAALAAARGTANGPAKGAPGSRPGAKPAGKRAKPAKAAKMASLALSAVTTIGLAGLFAEQNGQTDAIVLTQGTLATTPVTPATTATSTVTSDATASSTAATPAATAAPATAAPATAAGIKDGTYVGSGSANRFGTVQVQLVYSGGKIVDVQMLSYPNGDGRSYRISQVALPQLINETLAAQTAKVSSVSGATYTSKSYKKTLQSAIDAAKAASGVA